MRSRRPLGTHLPGPYSLGLLLRDVELLGSRGMRTMKATHEEPAQGTRTRTFLDPRTHENAAQSSSSSRKAPRPPHTTSAAAARCLCCAFNVPMGPASLLQPGAFPSLVFVMGPTVTAVTQEPARVWPQHLQESWLLLLPARARLAKLRAARHQARA